MQSIKVFAVTIALVAGGFAFAHSVSAQQAKVLITSSTALSEVKVGSEETITWQTQNFPAGAFLNINLVQKIGENPAQFELVRKIAEYTVNDGSETWKPTRNDRGENLYIEVSCGGATRFKDGCVGSMTPAEFAVIGGFNSEVANVWSAFISLFGF